MKNLAFLLTLLLTSACNDSLNIEPQQAISTNVALSDTLGVKTALIGTYDLLSNLPTFSGDVILNSELFADTENLFWTSFSLELNQILDKSIFTNNLPVQNLWIHSYQTINQANTILVAVEVLDEADQQMVEAELRFLRGLVYFDLVNFFAQPWTFGDPETNLGVPIISTPAEETLKNPEVPRNTVAKVYQFLIDDLLFAVANLPKQNGEFANTYAASALLSRVYLMQEKFDLAAAEADRVITSGQYELLTDLEKVFNQSSNSEEDIFAIQITPQDGVNRVSHYYSGRLEGGGGFIGITNTHMTKYETGDLRAKLFYFDQQSGTRRTGKWRFNSTNDGNVTTLRLAEMYLTRAEGRFRTGDEMGALQDINTIRNRAGLPGLSLSDMDLETILNERFLELVFEGHQFRDTKRNRKSFGDIAFDDPRMVYPIPQREMNVNGALVQNEGY